MLIWIGVARERRGERLGGGLCVPNAMRLGRTGLRNLISEFAEFGILGGLEAANLLFQSANAGDLADVGGNTPKEQVAGHVESARGDVALVGGGLHVGG